MTPKTPWACLLGIGCLWGMVCSAAPNEAMRLAYQEAHQALQAGDRTTFKRLSNSLVNYPLYPYLVHASLQRKVHRLAPDEIRLFTTRYADTPLAAPLQDAWLLAQFEQGHWAEIQDAALSPDNLTQRCVITWAQHQRTPNPDQVLDLAQVIWTSQATPPDPCLPLLRAHQNTLNQSPHILWERLRILWPHGKTQEVRHLIRHLPEEEQPLAHAWYRTTGGQEPPELPASFHNHPQWPALMAASWVAFIKKNPAEADAWLHKNLSRLQVPQSTQEAIIIPLVVHLALLGHPHVDHWMAWFPDPKETPQLRSWHVRQALIRSDWPAVLSAYHALHETEQNTPRWRYWQARALMELGQKEDALRILQDITQTHDFYALLAQQRLYGEVRGVSWMDEGMDPLWLAYISNQPGPLRARELFLNNQHTQAKREWYWYMSRAPKQERLAAAHLAQKMDWAHWSVLSLHHLPDNQAWRVHYPLGHWPKIQQLAESLKVDPSWILAIVLKESQFAHDIRSPAGAIGLMQLMPATATEWAERLAQDFTHPMQLIRTDLNLTLGSHYFEHLLTQHKNPLYALAAYNAGERKLLAWQSTRPQAMDQWVETLSYHETRKYLQKVSYYYAAYRSQLQQPPTSMPWLLAP